MRVYTVYIIIYIYEKCPRRQQVWKYFVVTLLIYCGYPTNPLLSYGAKIWQQKNNCSIMKAMVGIIDNP